MQKEYYVIIRLTSGWCYKLDRCFKSSEDASQYAYWLLSQLLQQGYLDFWARNLLDKREFAIVRQDSVAAIEAHEV